jgi:predicted ferric reductase
MTSEANGDRVSSTTPPPPRISPLQNYDPVWLLVVNAGVVAFMWFVHGGLERTETQGWLIAVGQLTGLYAALAALLGLVLISRAPWLERRYGMDRMTHFHRYTGFTAASLMAIHVVTVTVGYAWDTEITIWEQIVDSVANYPYVLNAVIGFALLMVVAVSSLRALRKVLAYEHWWFIHVGAYAGIALAFGHQTATGSDFVRDGWAVAYWTLLYLSAAGLIFGFRWITPLVLAVRHRLEVRAVEVVGSDAVTVVLSGRDLDRLRVQAGQFFLLRVLTAGRWWKAHPFSLSAPPDGKTLRFTIKALGDDTTALQTIAVGTRIAIEGPYGGFLPFRSTQRKLLYIAGGVGITPFRGLIDDVARPKDVALLYRNRRPNDALFLDELSSLSRERGFDLRLTYSRNGGKEPNPFDPNQLRDFVPDVADREVFVVGSPRLISAAKNGLRAAGVPARNIHYENFSY